MSITGRLEIVNGKIGKIFFGGFDLGVVRYDLKLIDEESKDFVFMSVFINVKEV
jgi:hypothetical protein